MPDIIISGPAGTGKTTVATILAYAVAGRGNTLILDASVEGGVKVMRGKVKNHAMTYGDPTVSSLKIIIFDEADNLSFPAQQALRRTIEKYSKYFRCIFICNYIRKIIDPIKSRCVKYTFGKLKKEDILKRLNFIATAEKIEIIDDSLEKIVDNANGDLRKCILVLDAVKKGASIKNFTGKSFDKIFVQYCLKGELIKLRDYINQFVYDSQDLKTVLINSLDLIIDSKSIPKDVKYELISLIGECEYRLSLSSDYYITSQWLCANVYKVVSNFKEKNK